MFVVGLFTIIVVIMFAPEIGKFLGEWAYRRSSDVK